MADVLGIDCYTYYTVSDDILPVETPETNWILINNVRDETLDFSRSKADVSRRGPGVAAYRAGRLDVTLTMSMVYDQADTAFQKFYDAFRLRAAVFMALLDGPVATNGSKGVVGSFSVINMSAPRNLDDAVIVDFELAPYVTSDGYPVSWAVVTSGVLGRA
jgi:hypothetical protein